MTGLDTAFVAAKQRLQQIAASAATTAWDRLPHYDEANIPPFLAAVLPLLAGANTQSVALTQAFLGRQLARQPPVVDATQILGTLRGGTQPAEVYRRPFVTVWSELKAGKPWAEAVGLGRSRAAAAAAMDVQLAFTHTLVAAGEADDAILGYRRVTDPGACPLCRALDQAKFSKGTRMPAHVHCSCGAAPLTEPFEPTATPDTVEVREHGEYGPTLTVPGQHFAHA